MGDVLDAALRCGSLHPNRGVLCALPPLHDGAHHDPRTGEVWTARPRPATAPYAAAMDALGAAVTDLAYERLRDSFIGVCEECGGDPVDLVVDGDGCGVDVWWFDPHAGREVRREFEHVEVVGPLVAALTGWED